MWETSGGGPNPVFEMSEAGGKGTQNGGFEEKRVGKTQNLKGIIRNTRGKEYGEKTTAQGIP